MASHCTSTESMRCGHETVRIPGTGEIADTTFTVDRRGEQLSVSKVERPGCRMVGRAAGGIRAPNRSSGGELDGGTITATGDVIEIPVTSVAS